MKKWSAHMPTGIETMTTNMTDARTCRTDAVDPACRRGETRGAVRVARFAVVAVMAMVFGLAGFVANAEAVSATYNTEKDNGTTLGSLTTNWTEAAGVDATVHKITTMSVGGTFGTAAGDRVVAANFATRLMITTISGTPYATDTFVTGISYRSGYRERTTTADQIQIDLGYVDGSGFVSFGNVVESGLDNTIQIRTSDLSAISGVVPSGAYLAVRTTGINGSSFGNELRHYPWETGNEAQLIVDECSPGPVPTVSGSRQGNPIDITTLVTAGTNIVTDYKVVDGVATPFTPLTDDFAGKSNETADFTGLNWTPVNSSEGLNAWCTLTGASGSAGTMTNPGNPQPYLYIESSANSQPCGQSIAANSENYLESPLVDAGSYDLTLAFDYNMEVSSAGATVRVDVWDGSWTNGVFTVATGNQGTAWQQSGTLDLAGAGYTSGNIRLRITAIPGATITGDIGFDNIVIDGTPRGTILYDSTVDPELPTAVDTTGWTTATLNLEVTYTDNCGITGKTTSGTFDYIACDVTGAPTLSLGTVTASSVQLNWTDLTNESSYNIYDGAALVANVAAGTTTYTHSSLAGNSSHSYTVVGVGTGPCEGTASNVINALTLPASPGTPTFTSVAETTLTVNWTAAAGGAASYDVYRGGVLQSNVVSPTVTYNDSSLSGNTSYDYYIVAKNATGDSTQSGTGTQLTLPGQPGTPTFTSVTSSSMTVNWAAPTGGAASYDVYRDTVFIANVATNSYADSGLSISTSYDYYIVAKNATGDGTQSGTGTQTTSACTPTVTAITLSSDNASIDYPETSANLSIAVSGGSGAISSTEWSVNGTDWFGTGTAYTAPVQASGTETIMGRATEDSCGTTITSTNLSQPYDTRTPFIEPGTASRAQFGVDKVKVTMPYVGINDNASASVSISYDLNAAAQTPVTIDPITGAGPATIDLGPFADGDAITNIVVTYADTRWGAAPGNAVQALADITIVAWFDNQMLHNSLRFACSVLDSNGKTITDQATCENAPNNGAWNEDRRYTGGWGTSGADDQYGPILCATCHEKTSGNIKRVTTTIGLAGIPGAAETISYTTAVDGSSDLAEAAGDHGSSNKVCEACHTYSATDPSVSTPTGGVRFHGYDMSGASVANQNHYLGADCISCHEHKIGFRASCNACHSSPPVDAGGLVTTDPTGSATWGKHDQHVNGQGYTNCDTCHTGWSVGGEMPNGGNLNIGFNLLPGTPSNTNSVYDGRAAGAYNVDTGNTWVTNGGAFTCANYCHGSTVGGSPAASWNHLDVSWSGCGECHGADAATPPANPASGTSHATHAGSGGMGLDCSFCHGSEYAAGTTAPAGHTNGSTRYNAAKLATTYEWYGVAAAPTYRGTAVGADGGVIAPDSANYGTCTNVSCHWGTTTPTWNNGPTTCTTCHNDGSVTDPNDVTEAAPNTGAHTKHVTSNANYVDCDSCHGAGAITGSHSGHINNATTIAGVTGYVDVGGRGNYADTCGTACHQTATWNGVINWTGGVTDNCLDCHSDRYHTDGNAGPQIVTGGVSGTASHVKYAAADGTPSTEASWTSRCQQCHTKHSGTIVIPLPTDDALKTALGIDYFGHGQISLNPYSGSTNEAATCWNCHDANSISEWGQNNNATTGGLNYDYGSLSGSDWTTATWYSAKGAASGEPFWYKSGAIQSTHSVNWTDGSSVVSGGDYNNTESPDLTSEIRCSYCHDVHDTFAATSHADESGQPYLRGRWKGNPYPEDGAPQSGMVDWTIAGSGTQGYGSVPRASASSTNTGDTAWPQTGGWWIDQNSGNPNSGETQASTAGLCMLCHNKDKGGSAVTVSTMDYETGENLWVSNSGTGNGHMNAVIGGSGSTNLAYNIFTTPERGSATVQSGDSVGPNYYPNMGGYSETTDRLESYRGVADKAVGLRPLTGNESGEVTGYRGHAFYYFNWGLSDQSVYSAATLPIASNTVALVVDGHTSTDGKVAAQAAQTQSQFHTFNCGKCHNPHASRLPKLMITNCLDTKQNTWDDDFDLATGAPSPWTNTYNSQWPSAQNCHRLSDGTQGDTTRARGDGWNKVTPW